MRDHPKPRRALPEPERPAFVDRLRRFVASTADLPGPTRQIVHLYEGWMGGREGIQGWRTQITLPDAPERTLEIWYDHLDHDVYLLIGREYQEWSLEPWTADVQQTCLDQIGRRIEDFVEAGPAHRDESPEPATRLELLAKTIRKMRVDHNR